MRAFRCLARCVESGSTADVISNNSSGNGVKKGVKGHPRDGRAIVASLVFQIKKPVAL